MNDEATERKHTGAVAFVRWQLAAEKYNALARAHADRAVDAEALREAADEVSRRHAEWMAFASLEPRRPEPGARRNLH
jgi:hypothetical protein